MQLYLFSCTIYIFVVIQKVNIVGLLIIDQLCLLNVVACPGMLDLRLLMLLVITTRGYSSAVEHLTADQRSLVQLHVPPVIHFT